MIVFIAKGINAPSFEALEKMATRLRMGRRGLFDLSGAL
jgi:hypothetical protein